MMGNSRNFLRSSMPAQKMNRPTYRMYECGENASNDNNNDNKKKCEKERENVIDMLGMQMIVVERHLYHSYRMRITRFINGCINVLSWLSTPYIHTHSYMHTQNVNVNR